LLFKIERQTTTKRRAKMIDNITFDEVFDDDRPQPNAGPHPHAMMDITNTKQLEGADMDLARIVSGDH